MEPNTLVEVRHALLAAARIERTPEAGRRAKQGITDGMAVALAGFDEPVGRVSRATLSTLDGPGESAIWGSSERAAPGSAVFANAAACHALGWDDYTQPMFGHGTAVLLPVCSELADTADASGSAVLDAYLGGYEVNNRLGEVLGATHYDLGWHSTSTIGAIGAAVAAARLLKLDDDQTWHAMGIAASSAAGFQGNFGAMTKSLHAGNAARAGLAAARLAQGGATANPNWLLSPTGYLALMGAGDLEKAALRLTAERAPGLAIEGDWGLVLKPYCCCGSGQPMIRAVVEVLNQNGVAAEQIDTIEVHLDPAVLALLIYDRPATATATYSLPYLAAIAALDRAAGPAQFTADSIVRDDVRQLMSRVSYQVDRTSPANARYRAEVTVRTLRGDTFSHSAEVAEGHPSVPMSDRSRRDKFDQGAGRIAEADRDTLYAKLQELDNVAKWSEITAIVARS